MYLGLSLLLTWITIKLVIVFVTPGGDLRDHMAGNRLLGRTLFSRVLEDLPSRGTTGYRPQVLGRYKQV